MIMVVPSPSVRSSTGTRRWRRRERRAKAAALAPYVRALASTDKPVLGHFTDSDVVLDFLASAEHPRLAALGTSCPDHFLRTKVKPLVLDLPADASVEDSVARLTELHAQYRQDYQAYYDRHATTDSPPLRGADPADRAGARRGDVHATAPTKQTARVAGEFYVNAINVMRGAESISTYAPIDESEKFRIEYWALEEAKLQRMPKPRPHAGRIALVTGAAQRDRQGHRDPARRRGACVVDRRPRPGQGAGRGGRARRTDVAVGVAGRRHRRRPGRGRGATPRCWRSVASTSWSTTPGCPSRSRCWKPPRPTGTSSTT